MTFSNKRISLVGEDEVEKTLERFALPSLLSLLDVLFLIGCSLLRPDTLKLLKLEKFRWDVGNCFQSVFF